MFHRLISAQEILKKYWGYSEFRPLQLDIINSVLEGNDTLALLPTGGGKSICFQVPALVINQLCIVISPLIALMKDQVQQLQKRGISALAIYSGMNLREIDIALDNCVYGEVKFLYVSPERLKTEIFKERVKKMKVGLIAVDEAHCISQWGYDFRPPYLEIASLRSLLNKTPVIALTATATTEVRQDIVEKLKFKPGKIFVKSFARTNLSYSVFEEEDKDKKLLEILKAVKGSSVVYVRNRRRTAEISTYLNAKGIKSDFYHAGLSNQERNLKQDAWITNKMRVIVSTNAFGMGIDKPDVRSVINYDLPDNIESYYQEAGRAGRDEKKAYAVLLYNPLDIKLLQEKLAESIPETDFIRKIYQCLANYFKIAVGSNLLSSFDFDLDDFSSVYRLKKTLVYNGLKVLEKHGFIEFNEAFYSPSKLFFQAGKEELYKFQVANPALDSFIKTLLRMYGGELFNSFIQINEKKIAVNIGIGQEEVKRTLATLQSKNFVSYEQQKSAPQIVFLTARFDAAKLPLDTNFLRERRLLEAQKADYAIKYAVNKDLCRSIFLSRYFGEEAHTDCEICDICIDKRKSKGLDSSFESLSNSIIDIVLKEPQSLESLVKDLPEKRKQEVLAVVRQLVDFGKLKYLENGKITVK